MPLFFCSLIQKKGKVDFSAQIRQEQRGKANKQKFRKEITGSSPE